MDSSATPLPFPIVTRGTKRSHAKRCCLACRKQKTRCELPPSSVDIPSSQDQLPLDKACHRCVKLGIPCVVFDDESKRKRRKQAAPAETSSSAGPSSSIPTREPTPPSVQQKSSSITQDAVDQSDAGGFFFLFSKRSISPTTNEPGTFSPFVSETAEARLSMSNAPKRDPSTIPDRSIMWRPLALLKELVFPQAGSRLRSEVETLSVIHDPLVTVNEELDTALTECFYSHILWLPHLPTPSELRQYHRVSPTMSSSLLLGAMYFIASKHQKANAELVSIRDQLASSIKYDLARVILSAPSDIHAVQALELLAVYAPFDVVPNEFSNGIALISAAKRISTTLRLSEAPSALLQLRTAHHEDTTALGEAIKRAAIFYSLHAWEITLANSDKDHLRLAPLPQEIDPVRVLAPEDSSESEHLVRIIGRVGLAHRVRSLQTVYQRSGQVAAILNESGAQRSVTHLSKLLFSLLTEAGKQRKACSSAFEPFMDEPKAVMMNEWIQMEARSGQLNIIGRALWAAFQLTLGAHVETLSMGELLAHMLSSKSGSTFVQEWGVRRLDIAESVLSGFAGLDPDLLAHHPKEGNLPSRDTISPSSLHAFGAPMSITCGIIVDAATSFVEAHAAMFMHWNDSSERVDSYLVILRQAALCLVAMDPQREGSVSAASSDIVVVMMRAISRWRMIARRAAGKIHARLSVEGANSSAARIQQVPTAADSSLAKDVEQPVERSAIQDEAETATGPTSASTAMEALPMTSDLFPSFSAALSSGEGDEWRASWNGAIFAPPDVREPMDLFTSGPLNGSTTTPSNPFDGTFGDSDIGASFELSTLLNMIAPTR